MAAQWRVTVKLSNINVTGHQKTPENDAYLSSVFTSQPRPKAFYF